MRRVNIFLALLITSLISLIVLIVAGFYVLNASPYPSNWMSSMWSNMGGMMGGTQSTTQNPALPYFGVLFIVLVGIAIASVGGLVYYIAFPEVRTAKLATAVSVESLSHQNLVSPYESVVKTLTDEEREVIEVLKAHDGKYLQK
jgi:uncharacterized membrane protein